MQFILKKLGELTPIQVYKMLQLRHDVFVIEQNCIYRDMDEKDYNSFHLLMIENDEVIACCRLVNPGISYNEPSIGRVCSVKAKRMEGIGMVLMTEAMRACNSLWPGQSIVISAQSYLEKFYSKFGFKSVGKQYLEDDIPHIKMIAEIQG
jgi:ElaA protein